MKTKNLRKKVASFYDWVKLALKINIHLEQSFIHCGSVFMYLPRNYSVTTAYEAQQ